ncbi:MAG: hypothetical protein UZ15_CFX003001090 [Chloroflexi bacterium OLB15]|nr:MAG: hypothetical protein UZ15_CFX003001090 [Chloroflexi bacterium OLB15]
MPDIGGMVGGTVGLTVGIIIVSFIFAGVIAFVVIRWSRKYSGKDAASQELLRTGIPAQARIVQITETNMYINEMPVLNLLLEVYPQNGQPPYQAWVQRRVPMYQMMQYQIGASLPVRFNPADPTKIAIAM